MESYVLLVPFNSKVANVLMRENLTASLACKSMRKMAISCTFSGHTASAVLVETHFRFLPGKRKRLCETNTCFDFFFFFSPTRCMEGIIPPWFHTVSLSVFLLLIYPKSIWLFMCGCWEMMNGVVATDKYEIPGSLTGLDWREKCIISPWMQPRLRGINIILSEIFRESEEKELEEKRKGGMEQLKMTNSVIGTAQWGPDYYRGGPSA